MDAAEDQRRAETAGARGWYVQWHLGGGERSQAPPQPTKLCIVDADTGATGVDQPSLGIIVGEQQRAQPGPRAFGIGPAHNHELFAVQAFDFYPQAAIARRIGRIDALRDDPLYGELACLSSDSG